MMKISNLKIGSRLGLGFVVVVVLLVVVALVGLSQIVLVNRAANIVVKERVPQVLMAQKINNNLNVISSASRSAILMAEESLIKTEIMVINEANNGITEALNNLEKLINSEEERALFKEVVDARAAFTEATDRLVKLAMEKRKEEAIMVLSGEVSTAQFAYTQSLGKFTEYLSASVEKADKTASNTFAMAGVLMLAFGISAVVVAVLISYLATRSITRPLNEALGIAETVASGDLTSRIDVHAKDETGRMMQALQVLNNSLTTIVYKVRNNTEAIATASSQIATGNQDLSARTERQAGTLEETAASMEELTSTVRRNSDNAHSANQLAVNAAEVAVKGGEAVMEVVQRMREIHSSSKKIEDIIAVIDGIAFQTNILSLNAAVEAARAGEQGREFAVVASEVRALAQRSALAAKEIKTLIHESVEKVGAGNVLAEQAGTTMEDVVASIKRVNEIMSEIAQASREQSEGIEQVNQAMVQMDQVTQQNAALVEESVAAVGCLHEQTLNLLETVSVFKTGDAVMSELLADIEVADHKAAESAEIHELTAIKSYHQSLSNRFGQNSAIPISAPSTVAAA